MSEQKRVRRQLPQPPTDKAKSSRKSPTVSVSVSPEPVATTVDGGGLVADVSANTVPEAGSRLTFSPPGSKPRVFMGYTPPEVAIESPDGEDSSVTVAVRVRPLSEREVRLCAKPVIRMHSNETTIVAKDGTVHRFCYDYSFWSLNHLQDHASQEMVYKELAQPLLDRAFEGYNTCLFAYGQTGSGKSYCIMGEPDQLGVVPRFSQELFNRMEGTKDAKNSFKVEVSYYEIYNEKIHDLLASTKKKSHVNLRVREHPVMGPYVEDLSTYVASTYTDVEQWIALGNRFRATAATGMNERSSRSHSVFTILLTHNQITEDDDEQTRVSRINLIDLAGSERSSVAQTSGQRLKEGANINRSLHTLGKVISLLSEKSLGKRKRVYIPYRDSTLTWLLKESLGGNSKTAMIATISPADMHYAETLSTLRYAQQARSIVNVAKINEDPSSKLIRDLRREIEFLHSQLSQQGGAGILGMGQVHSPAHSREEVKKLQEKLWEYEKLMTEMTRSWSERLERTEQRKLEEAEQLQRAGMSFKVDNRLPNLVNLNDDPQLSEMLLYLLKEGETTVGRLNNCDIQLTGSLVMKDHCTIMNKEGAVSLNPSFDNEAQTFVNGTLVAEKTVLHHGDRVVIGGEHFFRFNHPLEVEQGTKVSSSTGKRGFQFAKEEYVKTQTARLEAEHLREKEEMMKELQAIKLAAEEEAERQKASYFQKLRSLEETVTDKSMEVTQRELKQHEAEERITALEKMNKQLEEETISQRHIIELEKLKTQKEMDEMAAMTSKLMQELEIEKTKLEDDISHLNREREQRQSETMFDMSSASNSTDLILGSELLRVATMLQEANHISKNLNIPLNFNREHSGTGQEVRVRVTNTSTNLVSYWGLDKFESRLEQMREVYQHHGSVTSLDAEALPFDSNVDWSQYGLESDPFWDPSDQWEQDSLLLPRSPQSPSLRRQSVNLLFSSPLPYGSSTKLPEVPSSVPKRFADFLYSSMNRTAATSTPASASSSFVATPGHSTPRHTAVDFIRQLCCEQIGAMLQYKHEPHSHASRAWERVLVHIFTLKKIMLPLELDSTDPPELQQAQTLRLYISLELLLESALCLEGVVQMRPGGVVIEGVAGSVAHCSSLIENITRQTALYISRLLQTLEQKGTKAEFGESKDDVLGSLDGLIALLGELSLAVRVEDKLFGSEKSSNLQQQGRSSPAEYQACASLLEGCQRWCDGLLESLLHSMEEQLRETQGLASSPQLQQFQRQVIASMCELGISAGHLVTHISETQEVFWQSVSPAPVVDLVVGVLASAVWVYQHLLSLVQLVTQEDTLFDSLDSVATGNRRFSLACEELSTCLLKVLEELSYYELSGEVQSLSLGVTMASRSLADLLKRLGAETKLEQSPPLGKRTNELHNSGTSVSLPPEFFLRSPSPTPSEESSCPDEHESSESSLV